MYDSKVVGVELFNFMAIKHGKILFDEEGVINLKGYNHSGKTAILKGIAVCLTNYNPRTQAKYIHHGEEYFRVIVSFSDKVVIVRDKYKNGQSLYEMYKDGEKVFSTKQRSQLLRVDAVPDVIAEYLGLIETERGCLNIQFRKNPLWLVDTKGSDNYADLNTILRTVEISQANALANADKNKCATSVSRIEGELQAAKLSLEGYAELREDLLILLSERGVSSLSLLNSKDDLLSLSEVGESISAIKSIPCVEPVDTENLSALTKIKGLISNISNLPDYPEIGKTSIDEMLVLEKIKGIIGSIENLKSKSLLSVPVGVISVEELKHLRSIVELAKSYEDCNARLEAVKSKEAWFEKGKVKLIKKAKEEGITFVVCKNCGTLLEVKENE